MDREGRHDYAQRHNRTNPLPLALIPQAYDQTELPGWKEQEWVRRLWCAVIMRAVTDLISFSDRGDYATRGTARHFLQSEYLEDICEAIGIEFSELKALALSPDPTSLLRI